MADLDVLRGLGDQIVPPPLEALRETARRRTRRTTTIAVVSAVAVVAAVAGATFLTVSDDDSAPRPIGPPDVVNTTHPVTYAEGATIHYGEQAVTSPSAVVELDVTDDGVVARTEDGGIWFTDGADLEQVGTLGDPGSAYDVPDHPYGTTWGFVVSGNTGSRVAWFEFPQPGTPELVVYDTRAREEPVRQALEISPGSYALLASVTEDFAYWYTDPEPVNDDVSVPQQRVDLVTGEQGSVKPREYEADQPAVGTPRTMMISHAEGKEPVVYGVFDGTAWQFDVGGGRVEPQGAQPLDARDGGTATKLTFAAPDGYPDAAPNWLTQWLDDDTVVITVNRRGNDELLQCHISTRACTLAVTVPERAVMPEIG
jgi:hypothetical protein